MGVVERFIEFNALPTSRKTFLLMAAAFPLHLLAAVVLHFMDSAVLDESVIQPTLDAGVGVTLACMLAGALAMRRPGDGRWTVYFMVTVYMVWATTLLVTLGVYATPFLAYAFLLPLLVGLWFDERIGWITTAAAIVGSVVVLVLTLTGDLPFATAMDVRDIDEMRTTAWFLTVFSVLAMALLFIYALSFLTVRTTRLLDERLHESNRRLLETQELIRRYVPAQIAEQIVSGGGSAAGVHERRKLTLFFSDLVGFTDVSDELEPEDLSRLLNEYFTEMTAIAHRHGGTVDELSGDAILVFFGAPLATDDKDHALRAVRMAIEMQEAMPALNARWSEAGITEQLSVRMGVNTGVVTVGNFGSPERMKYAVLGKHVNLASRLQASCEPGAVVVSHATYLLVQDQIPCTPRGEVQLKGLHKPVLAYTAFGAAVS